MAYWACAQLDSRREALAQHCLGLAGYTTYQPRIATARGASAPLFPRYTFIEIVCGWWQARWSPGVVRLIRNGGGDELAHVPDTVIAELRSRERNGVIVLPPPPSPELQFLRGDRVKLTGGPLTGLSGLVEGMKGYERVMVLLELLGGVRSIEMAAADVERKVDS
jgi:transcription antitermination factor NusG